MLSTGGSIRRTALCVNEKRIAVRCCLPSEIINFSWRYLFVNYRKQTFETSTLKADEPHLSSSTFPVFPGLLKKGCITTGLHYLLGIRDQGRMGFRLRIGDMIIKTAVFFVPGEILTAQFKEPLVDHSVVMGPDGSYMSMDLLYSFPLGGVADMLQVAQFGNPDPVSYTHLTLPTIYSV